MSILFTNSNKLISHHFIGRDSLSCQIDDRPCLYKHFNRFWYFMTTHINHHRQSLLPWILKTNKTRQSNERFKTRRIHLKSIVMPTIKVNRSRAIRVDFLDHHVQVFCRDFVIEFFEDLPQHSCGDVTVACEKKTERTNWNVKNSIRRDLWARNIFHLWSNKRIVHLLCRTIWKLLSARLAWLQHLPQPWTGRLKLRIPRTPIRRILLQFEFR